MAHNKFTEFLESHGLGSLAEKYESFFGCSSEPKNDEILTRYVLANIELKHKYAKELFRRALEDNEVVLMRDIKDSRLYSFLLYRLYVHILNAPIMLDGEESLRSTAMNILGINQYSHIETGCYLEGYSILCHDEHVPVRMSPGSELFHPGYRLFTINLLCFRDKQVAIGYRTDGFAPKNMLCHKGCRPLGVRKDAQGREWFLMKAGMEWSDDHSAIFSSFPEGDATIEICDWINEYDVRVIFRANI